MYFFLTGHAAGALVRWRAGQLLSGREPPHAAPAPPRRRGCGSRSKPRHPDKQRPAGSAGCHSMSRVRARQRRCGRDLYVERRKRHRSATAGFWYLQIELVGPPVLVSAAFTWVFCYAPLIKAAALRVRFCIVGVAFGTAFSQELVLSASRM